MKGLLRCRLDRELDHLHVAKVSGTSQCAMHRWAGGDEVYANVSYCPTCRVNLCVNCYRPFHYDRDLVDNKSKYCPKKPDSMKRKKQLNSSKHYLSFTLIIISIEYEFRL